MYTCRWAYCATVCGTLDQLDEHVFKHIEAAPEIQLTGVKRRKVDRGTWITLGGGRGRSGVDGSQIPQYQPISDVLPVHASQTGDYSITTDTNYPIPSFPQPLSFPSPILANYHGSQPAGTQDLSAEINLSQADEAEIAEQMSRDFLRSPTPPAESSLKHPVGAEPSSSPFVPPTQAYLTQPEGASHPPPSSTEQPHTQSDNAQTQSTNTSQSSQPQRTPESSMEIGRAAPSPLGPSPPDLLARTSMPPPAVPIVTPVQAHRESAVRRASVSRPLHFGSAVTLVDGQMGWPKVDAASKERGVGSSGGPRRSVGFTFGSQLGSSPGDQSK